MELFTRNYIENETKETKAENERLQNEVNSLETENETLKSRKDFACFSEIEKSKIHGRDKQFNC